MSLWTDEKQISLHHVAMRKFNGKYVSIILNYEGLWKTIEFKKKMLFDLINVTRCPRDGFHVLVSPPPLRIYFGIRSPKTLGFSFHIDLIDFHFCVTLLSAVQFVTKCFCCLNISISHSAFGCIEIFEWRTRLESVYKYVSMKNQSILDTFEWSFIWLLGS